MRGGGGAFGKGCRLRNFVGLSTQCAHACGVRLGGSTHDSGAGGRIGVFLEFLEHAKGMAYVRENSNNDNGNGG